MTRPSAAGWRLDPSYARLGDGFAVRLAPAPARQPRLVVFNRPLARALGLDPDVLAAHPALFTGNQLPEGAEPIAQAYAGHQFGHFTTLGDGRALLLGEHLTPVGERFDIQLKGSGPTPFSRGGDGRAALGPMLREYVISEAMAALGVPTTRSLAVASTGEPVLRQTAQPGAVLTRVAASHLRVGTFQYFAARGDEEAVSRLVDYTLARHFPDADRAAGALSLLEQVAERQAALVARWLHVGFIHGVMNTDNMALSGETIDYGPCAFLDHYDPQAVLSSIDHQGRYAYGNQPTMARWNLARFAEALLPLLDAEPNRAIARAEAVLEGFTERFEQHWLAGMRAKLGLFDEEPGDRQLVEDFLDLLHQGRADFTNGFRALASENMEAEEVSSIPAFSRWRGQWQARLARQGRPVDRVRERIRAHSPFVIARNHRVEQALRAAEGGDLAPLERLLEVLARPYAELPEHAPYRRPPAPAERVTATFCGT